MGRRRRASSVAAAVALAAAGVAGIAAVVTPTVGPLPYTAYTFPGQGSGVLPGGTGAPVNYGALAYQQLQYASATQCQYIENSFEDDFTVSLNLSRWLPTGSALASAYPSVNPTTGKGVVGSANGKLNYGTQNFGGSLDHCPSAGSVGAANPSTCVYLNPGALAFGADLPDYAQTTGITDKGLIMTLSQDPCFNADGSNNAQCCNTQSVVVSKSPLVTQQISVCAAWSGAHLSSQSCVQYGTTEVEAAFDMPQEGGGIQFFGKCVRLPLPGHARHFTDSCVKVTSSRPRTKTAAASPPAVPDRRTRAGMRCVSCHPLSPPYGLTLLCVVCSD